MEIIPLDQNWYNQWADFCLSSDQAWFWHTKDWLEYTLHYRPKLESKSLSFIVINNSKIEGICPLLLEVVPFGDKLCKEFSFGGAPGPIPAVSNGLPKKIEEKRFKLILDYVDELAHQNKVVRVSFRGSPLAPESLNFNRRVSSNYLAKCGYISIPIDTQIIDLSKSEAELRADVRHGHSYDIDRGEKYIQIRAFDKENITNEIYDRYQQLHRKAAGRVTRPQATFQMMYNWLLGGNAVLFAASIKDEFVGFSYVYLYKNAAYYGSACNDPDHAKDPIGHVIQWSTIKWLKEHGFKYFELGCQYYDSLPYCIVSRKEIDISAFKRGFGGFAVQKFIGEKYYDPEFCQKVNTERIAVYAKTLGKNKTETTSI